MVQWITANLAAMAMLLHALLGCCSHHAHADDGGSPRASCHDAAPHCCSSPPHHTTGGGVPRTTTPVAPCQTADKVACPVTTCVSGALLAAPPPQRDTCGHGHCVFVRSESKHNAPHARFSICGITVSSVLQGPVGPYRTVGHAFSPDPREHVGPTDRHVALQVFLL